MNSTHEPQSPKNTGETSISALNWVYALDDSALLEGRMAPAYPQGVNVVLARVVASKPREARAANTQAPTKTLPEVCPLYIASEQLREMTDTQVNVNGGDNHRRVSVSWAKEARTGMAERSVSSLENRLT